MLTILIGLILFFIFILLSGIHFYWGLGGKWAAKAVIPTKEDKEKGRRPKLSESFIVALGLFGFGIFILVKTEILSLALPAVLLDYGIWVLSLLFLLRAIGDFKYVGFFKKIKTTEFGRLDTIYYSPLCLAIAFMAIMLAFIK
ncbi:MAG: DUF3995 domain-containing protein [Panacibacter sp.]